MNSKPVNGKEIAVRAGRVGVLFGGTSNTAVYYTVVAGPFVGFDVYVGVWYLSLNFHFPGPIWSSLVKLATGTLKDTQDLVQVFVAKQRGMA